MKSGSGQTERHAFLWQNGKMIDLGTLGGSTSEAVAVNEQGQVIGMSTTASGAKRAFLWQDGKMIDLGILGKPSGEVLRQRVPQAEAVAINDRGQVVGTSWTARGVRHAFMWEHGRMRDLGALGSGQSSAEAINNNGQIVGSSRTGAGTHAFLWQNGRMVDLGTLGGTESYAEAINDRGQVTGLGTTKGMKDDIFLWERGSMRGLGFSGFSTWPIGINRRGAIAGYGSPGYPKGTDAHALLWDGKTHDLGTLGGPESQATAIDNHGLVVGWSHTLSCHRPVPQPERTCGTHAFVWQDGRLDDLGTLGGKTSDATAIADGGQIVGSSLTRARPRASSVHHAVLWTT